MELPPTSAESGRHEFSRLVSSSPLQICDQIREASQIVGCRLRGIVGFWIDNELAIQYLAVVEEGPISMPRYLQIRPLISERRRKQHFKPRHPAISRLDILYTHTQH